MKPNTTSIPGESSSEPFSLDEIMQTATRVCERAMRSGTCMPHTVLTFLRDGAILSHSLDKDIYQFEVARQLAIYFRARAIVCIRPGWHDSPLRRKAFDLPPSKFPDWLEGICISAESGVDGSPGENCDQLLLFPLCNEAGEFTGFATDNPGLFDEDFLGGVLPFGAPTHAEQMTAEQCLKDMGITLDGPYTPSIQA